MSISPTVQRGSVEHQSFFPLWASSDHFRRGRSGTSSHSDSPGVSPFTERPKPLRRPVTRKTASHRSTSRSAESPLRFPIPEEPHTLSNDAVVRPSNRLRRSLPADNVTVSQTKRRSSLSTQARRLLSSHRLFSSPPELDSSTPDLPESDTEEQSPTLQASWLKRQKAKFGFTKNAQNPKANTVTTLMKSKAPKQPQKLQPPKPLSVFHLPQHPVKIETDFTELPSPSTERPAQARHGSHHGKKVYDKSKRMVQDVHDQYARHRSAYDFDRAVRPRNDTDEAIRRVSSILFQLIEDTTPKSRKIPRFEFFSTTSSHSSPENAYKLDFNLSHPRSNISFTSSIRELRRGVVPAVSPDPDATYRARLHPDAPSEEFLKIDISEPGGTSYLPSEARRIHTPPLPGEGPNQKRRGFFFDYNAPRQDSEEDAVPSFLDRAPDGIVDHGTHTHVRKGSSSQSSHPATIGTRYLPRSKAAGKSHAVDSDMDWYTAQLLDLDRQDRRASLARNQQGSASESSGGITDRTHDGAEIDHRIPDHYPSSPLCPRHPKHKSKGRGVCWMHGRNPPGRKHMSVELKVGGTDSEV